MIAPTKQMRVVIALGSEQTLAWGSTYYLPAILAAPMANELGVATGTVFGAFSAALVVAAVLGPMAGRRIDLCGGRDVLASGTMRTFLAWTLRVTIWPTNSLPDFLKVPMVAMMVLLDVCFEPAPLRPRWRSAGRG